MGFFDDITSIFTAPGTSQANAQNDRNSQIASYVSQLLPILMPLLKQQAQMAGRLEPQLEDVQQQLINSLNPANQQGVTDMQKNAVFANYAKASPLATLGAKAAGLGSGYQAGQQASLAGQAARGAAQIDVNALNPLVKAQQLQAQVQAIQGGQSMPGLGAYNTLATIGYGQPKSNVGAGFGEILGNLAGSLGDLGWKPFGQQKQATA